MYSGRRHSGRAEQPTAAEGRARAARAARAAEVTEPATTVVRGSGPRRRRGRRRGRRGACWWAAGGLGDGVEMQGLVCSGVQRQEERKWDRIGQERGEDGTLIRTREGGGRMG